MRIRSYSRAWIEERQAREVFESYVSEECAGHFVTDYVHFELNEFGHGALMKVQDIPLPRDFSPWEFGKNSTLYLDWQSDYSEEHFRRELAIGHVYASLSYAEGDISIGQSLWDGLVILGEPSSQWTKQYALEVLPKRIEALGMQGKWRVDWGFSGSIFQPLIVDIETGLPAETGGIVKCMSPQHSWGICQRLMAAHDFTPTHMGGDARLDHKNPLQSFAEQYQSLQKAHPTWTVGIHGVYAKGFDPFVRPKKVPRQGWHFPLAHRDQDNRCGAQLNLVHQPTGSYLELMTEFGPSVLRDWAKRLKPKLKWEIWKGDPAQRWDGDATPLKPRKLPKAPPLMFRNDLDLKFGCFVHQRKLTLFIHSHPSLASTREESDRRQKLRLKRSWDGYTYQECDHWEMIDQIESRFDEIAALYTGWDSIRFWWPNPDWEIPAMAKQYWKDRPTMRKMKTLPMKVRGKTLQIPVEFVEPLKCPM